MFGNLSGPTLLVILFIVLLLFGAPKLPGLARSLGQSMKILRKEVRNDDSEESTGDAQTVRSESAESSSETSAPAATPSNSESDTKSSSS